LREAREKTERYLISLVTDDSSSKVLLEDGLGESAGEGDSEDLAGGSEEVGDWREREGKSVGEIGRGGRGEERESLPPVATAMCSRSTAEMRAMRLVVRVTAKPKPWKRRVGESAKGRKGGIEGEDELTEGAMER